jgi:hypothetical protein
MGKGEDRRIAMRTILFALFVLAATPHGRAEAAPTYRYCAEYEDRGDMTCAYDTFQQCLETARGVGGSCRENPFYRPTPAAPARQKGKRKTG